MALKANLKTIFINVVSIAALLLTIWILVAFPEGRALLNRFAKTVLKRPVELLNSTENLPASSLKGLSLTLPYPGTLTIEAVVVHGNEVNISMIEPGEFENLKNRKQFLQFADYEAVETKNYKRSSRMPAGNYYLVLMDKHFGSIPAAATDVKVVARLAP